MTGLSLLIICMQQQSSLLAAASGPAPYRNHEWAAAAQLPAAPSVLVPVTFVWLPTSPTTTIRHSYTTVNNIVSTTFIFFDCQENSIRIRPCLKFIKNQIEIIRIHRPLTTPSTQSFYVYLHFHDKNAEYVRFITRYVLYISRRSQKTLLITNSKVLICYDGPGPGSICVGGEECSVCTHAGAQHPLPLPLHPAPSCTRASNEASGSLKSSNHGAE